MARVRDRTEDFKDAVRHTAVSLGYDEVYLIFQFIILKLFLRCFSFRSYMENLNCWGKILVQCLPIGLVPFSLKG